MAITTSTGAQTQAIKNLPLCPKTPNCVSSQAHDQEHFIAPFKIAVSADSAWNELTKVLQKQPRMVVRKASRDSLEAEASSLIFRFVDDLNFILDTHAGIIHIRSAARTGYSDLGVNRKRLETIRGLLIQAGVIK